MDIATKRVWKEVGLWCYYIMLPVAIAPYVIGDALINGLIVYPWLAFIMLAAILNAVMDSIENEHILDTKASIKKELDKKNAWANAVGAMHFIECEFPVIIDSYDLLEPEFQERFLKLIHGLQGKFDALYDSCSCRKKKLKVV